MKKLFALIAVTGMLLMMVSNIAFAQEPEATDQPATEQTDSTVAAEEEVAPAVVEEETAEAEPEMSLHKQVKRLFRKKEQF